MNKASVEQALTGLIPTLNGPPPPDLVEFSLSLLARSRSVAQSLKPDEEIARPYACAQLACERLKKRLNLPPITARPPCPPRIYKKLYNYLESALPAATPASAPSTPRKTAAQDSASTRTTPKTPISSRKTPRSTARHNGQADEPPEWVMSTIRALVKAFTYPAASPHIYTGVESTFPLLVRMTAAAAPKTPSKRPRRTAADTQTSNSEISDTRVLALIATILFYVLSRMQDQEITPEQYEQWRSTAVATLLMSEAGGNTSEENLVTEIEELMPLAQEEGWLQMEWFLNVEPAEEGDEMEGVEMTKAQPMTLKDSFSSENIGLGTMMQEATDYLSERQRQDYKIWKARIMARVEEIEARA